MIPPASRVLLLVTLGVLAGALGACRGNTPTAAPAARRAPAGETTQAFEAMRGVLVEGAAPREGGDAAGLRQRNRRIVDTGMALLTARMPHDLRRADLSRFLEGRAVFGDALKGWVRAIESGGDEAVLAAFDDLVEAYWGWVDASQGRSPERAV